MHTILLNEGIYVVPETGLYVFSWTITVYGHSQALTQIMVNGHQQGDTLADSEVASDLHTSTGTLVNSFAKGDHVYIQLYPIYYVKGSLEAIKGQCSFSGWKIA